jgi:hypothetical protein
MLLALALFVLSGAALLAAGVQVANALLLAFDLAAVVFLGILAWLFNHS